MALEKPSFRLIRKDHKFELRDYDPYISARISVNAEDYRDAANKGFRPLANYIFGANESRGKINMTAPVAAQANPEKIAMTAPVTVQKSDTYNIEFMIPEKYTLESLPQPIDERVHFVQHPARRIAAIRFSGSFSQVNFEKHIKLLEKWITDHGMQKLCEPIIAGYNPPFVPNFLKHNEILIEVSK